MQLGLPPHVHMCVSGSMAVFLDARRDRYRAVRLTAALEAIASGRAEAEMGDPMCARLAAEGLLVSLTEGVRSLRPMNVETARSSVLETGRSRGLASFRTTAMIGCALLAEDVAMKRGLSRRLERLASPEPELGADQDLDQVIRLALAFADHRAMLPWRRICLRDSLALLRLLQARNCTRI